MAAVRTTAGTMSPRHRPRRRHRRGPILRLTAATALLPGLLASSGDPVGADQNGTFTIGEVKAVEPASTTETPLRPGDTLTYTVNFSCSIAACDGATITDVLPAYTDLTGASAQLSYVSESSPPAWQFDGVSTNGDGRQQIGWTAQALPAGSSGAIFVTMRIPPGTVRVTADPQEIVNQAVGALAEQTSTATSPTTYLNALAPSSEITKTGPATALLNAAGTDPITHTIRLCPAAGTALWPNYTVVDTLPVGSVVVTDPLPFSGEFVADPQPEPETGGTITWELSPANRPAPDAQGCLSLSFQIRYLNAAAGGHASNEIGATKTNSVLATGSDTGSEDEASQEIGPATTTLTLTGPVTRFSPSKDADGNFYVTDGETVVYRLGARNTSDAEAVPFSTATLTDGPLPAEFTLAEIHTGNWTGSAGTVTAVVQTSIDGTAWTEVATQPSAIVTDDLADVR